MATDFIAFADGQAVGGGSYKDDDDDKDIHPALRRSRDQLRARQQDEETRGEEPEEAHPALAASRESRSQADAEILKKSGAELTEDERRRKIDLLTMQQEALGSSERQQNKGALGDTMTAAKIGINTFTQGPAIRSEAERGLREIARDKVAGQLGADDIAGIEAIAGKKVGEMKWAEFTLSARKFYGELPKEEDQWLARSRWSGMLRGMMGFQEGDHNEATGQPAFTGAQELISGSQETMASGFGLQGIYEEIVRPIVYENGTDAKLAADEMAKSLVELRQEYSDAARAEDERPFVDPEATRNPLTWFSPFDDKTKGLRGIFNATIEQAPMIGGMIVSSRIGGRTGSNYAIRKYGSPTDTLERTIGLQKTGARAGGAAAGGTTEMMLIRDGVFHETQSRLMHETPQEMWDQNEEYQRLMEGGDLTSEEAKQLVGFDLSRRAGDMAMVISGALLGTPMGYMYGSATGVSAGRAMAKDAIVKRMAKGAALETVQEMGQEGLEQISSNIQVMKVNADVDWSDGLAEAMAGAAFVSGPYGAMGSIQSDRGAGVSIAKDKLIRETGAWMRDFNERVKFQNKQAKASVDQSPQERLKGMIELERMQEKEARSFLKNSDRIEQLLDESDAGLEQRSAFEAKRLAYETDVGMIAKRKKARLEARRTLQEEQRSAAERDQARKQVERDVTMMNENLNIVQKLQQVQRGEILDQQSDYDLLNKLGYGTFMGRNDENFILTDRGQRAMEEMSEEIIDTKQRLAAGVSTGERRTQKVLRESFEGLTDEEFERQVFRDETTGLWNKRKLNEDTQEKTPGGFAFLDADSLKWVNDNMSYSAGNEYMRTITREIESLGKGIKAYRYGGDEFVVTGPSKEAVQEAVEKALGRVNNAARVGEAGKSVKVSVSTGYGSTMDESEKSMKANKKRRTDEGLRQDTRIQDSSPPSMRTEEAGEAEQESSGPGGPRQMSLFALAAQGNKFDDDSWKSSNFWVEEDWAMYDMAADQAGTKGKKRMMREVDPELYNWIEEAASAFLPKTNKNNPPIHILHDHHWLSHIAPNQYKELLDLPFGGLGVRGMFSMDDPSHGVFLFADVIINEAEQKLPMEDRITSWNTVKHTLKDGDTIEVLDEEGNVELATVQSSSYKKTWHGGGYNRYGSSYRNVTRVSPSQRRLEKEGKRLVGRRSKLVQKETNLMKQLNKMSEEKRKDREHPLYKSLMNVFDELGAIEQDYQSVLDTIQLERAKAWMAESEEAEKKEKALTPSQLWDKQKQLELGEESKDTTEDQITVEMKDGRTIKFDPKENAPLQLLSEGKELPNVYLGRIKTPHSSSWRYNLGNEEAAIPPELTKEDVQAVVADTIMHETVGHFGIRGITKDWRNYVEVTHSLVDAFPEVVERLRIMGYNYRDDLDRPGQMDEANKALLGEEVMAWTAGEILGKNGMEGLNATQAGAVSRFLSWFKFQLVKMGFNDIYRKAKAAQIRQLRKRMHNAKTKEQRKEISKKLYGYIKNGERVPGLVFLGESGLRRGGKEWKGGKNIVTKTGTVARAQGGFLNDQDMLNLIQRSLDFIRSGRNRWKFTDHTGGKHVLPMRDMEIYRKPVHWVVLNATRKRTESEQITDEDQRGVAPIPTRGEAYEGLYGKPMPEGFRIVTPADFKDESKRLEREMTEGKTKEEIQQMRKDRLIPNPKQLYDEAVKDMSPEMLEQARAVQSAISGAKKKVEQLDAKLKAKKRNIEMLEMKFGKDVVESDEIPVFTESGTIQDYMVALKQALPTAEGGGSITQMEIEASGIIDKMWPSRVKMMLDSGQLPKKALEEVLGVERLAELERSNQPMSREEADAIIKAIEEMNSLDKAMGIGPRVPEMHLHAKKLMANNALTAEHFREYMADWVLSGHDANITTLLSVYGEDSQLVEDYIAAKALATSGKPEEQVRGRERMSEIMTAPINPAGVSVTRDWLAAQAEEPAYDVFVTQVQQKALDWKVHYEKITGNKPNSTWYDQSEIDDDGTRLAVKAAIEMDLDMGPDVGYDADLDRWIHMPISQASREWSGLMVDWIVPNSYFGTVFWQRPVEQHVYTNHFSDAHQRKYNMHGAQGIWAHTRNAAVYDADPDAPTAPNPARQGQAFMPFEFQADAIQRASKMYASQQELDEAQKQQALDGRHLATIGRKFTSDMLGHAVDRIETEWNKIADEITEDEVLSALIVTPFSHESYGRINNKEDARMVYEEMNVKEKRALKHAAIANKYHDTWGEAPYKDQTRILREMELELIQRSKNISNAYSQQNQDVRAFDRGEAAASANLQTAFIGDARMFEWNDYRALQNIFASLRGHMDNLHTHTAYYVHQTPESGRWKSLVEMPTDGIIKEMRRLTSHQPQPAGAVGANVKARKAMTEVTERLGAASYDNQPLHRIPFMKDRFVSVIGEYLQEANVAKSASQSYEDLAQSMWNDATQMHQLDMVIDAKMYADVFSVNLHDIRSAIHDWQANNAAVPFQANTRDEGDETVVSMFDTRKNLEEWSENYLESFREFLAIRLNVGEIGDAESQLENRQQQLNRKWWQMQPESVTWRQEFNIQEAAYRIGDDAATPLELKSDVKANGLTIEQVHESYEANDIQIFPAYSAERWKDIWDNMEDEQRQDYEGQGASETEPTDSWYQRFAEEWNNSTPMVVTGQFPTQWNQQSEPTEWAKFRLIKQGVSLGNQYGLSFYNERSENWEYDSTLDYWEYQNTLIKRINRVYDNRAIPTNPWRFKTLRSNVRALKQEVKVLQEQIASGLEKNTGVIDDLFKSEEAHPTVKINDAPNPERSFLRVIDYNKKKQSVFNETLMQKNDQWRNAQIMSSISHAVREGYPRIHLAYGSASGRRGGFLSDYRSGATFWHYANSATFELRKQMIRGQERQILELKPDNLKDPFWIDVTDDKLIMFEGRDQRETDTLDGYVSAAVSTQLGRDASRLIARKMMESHGKGMKQRLLVSGSGEAWFVMDHNSNVLSEHPSKRAAQNQRRSMQEGEEPVIKTEKVSGNISRHELGGPLMMIKTEYYGDSNYNLEDGSDTHYQHTFQPPTFAGMRQNYDVVGLARWRAYLNRFDLDIEEGWAKVDDSLKMNVVYAEGGRRDVTVAAAFGEKYPNLRVEEVEGDSYGWTVTSDKGLAVWQVFADKADADSKMDDMIRENVVEAGGRIKVYQVTINDELREEHEKPVNPWVSANHQVQADDPVLRSMLAKIGEPKRHWWDYYNPFKKFWRAEFIQGSIDRFYGIKYALNQTGKSLDSYKMARLTTGIDSIMRAVMEYGAPVRNADGSMGLEGEGLMQALAPVGDQLEHWAAYMAGRRGKALILEGYNKLSESHKRGIDRMAKHFDESKKDVSDTGEQLYTEAERKSEAHKERVWKALIHISTLHQQLMPKFDRRVFLRGLGSTLAVGASGVGVGKDGPTLEDLGIDPEQAREVIKTMAKGGSGNVAREKINDWVIDMIRKDPAKWDIPPDVMTRSRDTIMSWGRSRKDGRPFDRAKQVVTGTLNRERQSMVDVKSLGQKIKDAGQLIDKDVLRSALSFDELLEVGREKNFDPNEVHKAVQFGEQFDTFEQARQKYNRWRNKVLDFAEASGVINSESRKAWEEADYVPFFRIQDDRMTGAAAAQHGLVDTKNPIQKLKGAAFNTGDIIQNIFVGSTRLMDAATKNNAARAAVKELEGTGLIRKQPMAWTKNAVPGTELEAIFKRHDLDPSYIPPEVVKTIHTMFGIVPPKGDGIVSIMVDGKPEYYRTEDELLYRALTSVNHNVVASIWLRGPKKFLTASVTLDPGFMIANFVRDSMSAWVLSRDNYIPIYDGLRGAMKAIRTDETMQAMMAAGASFESGYINADDPASTHRYIRNAMKNAGFRRSVVDNVRKLGRLYMQFGSALENGNRVAIYDAAIKAGKSDLQAAFEAKDIMDFSMGGDWRVIQYLVQSVPFLNARVQGLYRLQRGARENPVAFAFKGSLLMAAGLALWFRYREDERYQRLEEWDKDAYFHFWIGEHHWRIPKGFEVGAIFNTLPERAMEYAYSKENDDGRLALQRLGHMLTETFAMSAVPQVAKGAWEASRNRNSFTGRDIDSPWDEKMLPKDRYRHYTSPTMVEGASTMPITLDTALHGKLSSPKHWQNFYGAYTGTLGRYALMISDAFMREMMDYPEAPDWGVEQFPVISRFYRGKEKKLSPEYMAMSVEDRVKYDVENQFEYHPVRGSKYEQVFYDEMRLVTMAMASMSNAKNNLDDERSDERYAEIEEDYLPYVERSNEFERYQRGLSKLNKESRQISMSREMDGAEKKAKLDAISREKQQLYKEAYDRRPSAMPEGEVKSIRDLIDQYEAGQPPSDELVKQAPITAGLLDGITAMNQNQMGRLAKSANYTPQGEE